IQIFELVDNNCPQGTDEIVAGICFVNEFGSTGSDDGEFNSPSGLALDSANDLLYVADTDNDRIQVFTTLDVTDKIPERPTNLDASAASPSSIILTWDAPEPNDEIPPITGYKIEFKKGSDNFTTLVADTKTTNTYFLHEGLADEIYTYQIYAINSEGISSPSSQSSAKPQHTTVPAGLTATAISPNQIRLSWTAPSETFGQAITDYTIKREIVAGVYEEIDTVDDKFTTYVVSNLATGKTYTYVVVANYALGSSDVSNSASATPQEDSEDQSSSPVTIPTSPRQLTATATSNQIKLSWNLPLSDGNSPITGYKIETKKDDGTYSVVIADTKSVTTSYTHTNVSQDTTYTYRVSAINSVGISNPSNEASANLAEVSLEIKPLGTFRINEGQTLSFTVGVTDSSLDDLIFSLGKGYPSGATINSSTGKFTWTPTKSQAPGPYVFDIVVRQGALEDSQIVTIYVDDVPDPTIEPTSKIASFVDPNKDPQHYVDRYNNEPNYKEWFDTNYPDRTIYEAVGLENPESKTLLPFVDPNQDPEYYIDRYNTDLTYREWFDTNYPEYSIYEAVGLETPMGFCGEGTTLIDGVCEVDQDYVKPKQKTCFLFWCW
ncbi:MAG TPA: fibronectin type III domain-containing protein, partial [Nitrosopumilaceae archaeon]|nr:fibronectin type III domain-containing protein [Nitrosopumilaceae archaeon]